MPKVSEAHREGRRRQIADAAIACMHRRGVANTTMADIATEAGLSAGALYTNFENKASLVRYVATTVIEPHMAIISTATDAVGEPATPRTVMRLALDSMSRSPVDLVVQIWAEAVSDPEMRAAVHDTTDVLRRSIADGITPWVIAQGDIDSDAVIERMSRVLISLCQGFVVSAALLGISDSNEYLDTIQAALTP